MDWLVSILVSQVAFRQHRTYERCLHMQWTTLRKRNTEFGEFTTLIIRRSKTALCHGVDILSHFSRLPIASVTLRMALVKNDWGLGMTCKTCSDTQDICSFGQELNLE